MRRLINLSPSIISDPINNKRPLRHAIRELPLSHALISVPDPSQANNELKQDLQKLHRIWILPYDHTISYSKECVRES